VRERRSVAPEDISVAQDTGAGDNTGADLAQADKRIPSQICSGVADHQ
jgi:hypothetical protein